MAAYMRLMRREEDFEERFRGGYRYVVDRTGTNGTKGAASIPAAVTSVAKKVAHLIMIASLLIIMQCCCDFRVDNNKSLTTLYYGGAALRYSILRYMICTARGNGRRACGGRIIVYTNGDVRSTRPHNHVPIPHEEDAYLFKFRLFQAVTTRFENARVIYDELAILNPMGALANPWGDGIQALIRRWRRQHRPPTPRSFDELSVLLTNGDWRNALQMGRVSFNAATVGEVGHRSILLYDPLFVRQFETSEIILVDGTFGSVPRIDFAIPEIGGIAQLLIIMGQKYDTVMPLFYVIMESRIRVGYDEVFAQVRRVMPRLRPAMTITDYERALLDSLNQTFPHAITHGCFFHYVQALIKNEKRLVPPALRQQQDVRLFLRRLAVLALLPAENIIETFNALCADLAPEHAADLQPMIEYYNRQWLMRVGPLTLSVCGLSRRTNNNCEAFNRILRDRMGRHPALWIFLRNLLLIQSRMNTDLRNLQRNGRARFAPNVGFVIRNDVLQNVWQGLAENRYTIDEALGIFVENLDDVVGIVVQHYLPQGDGDNPDEVAENAVENPPLDAGAADLAMAVEPPADGPAVLVAGPGVDADNEADDLAMAVEPPADGPAALIAGPGVDANNEVDENYLDNNEDAVGGGRIFNPGFPVFIVTNDQYDRTCVVCESEESCILIFPCFHQVCCAACANLVVDMSENTNRRLTCPYCRTMLTDMVRPFMVVSPDGIGRGGEDVPRKVGRYANMIRFSERNDRFVHLCSICNARETTVLLLPCKHEIMCTQCANNIADIAERERKRVVCPICESEVDFAHRVMVPPQ